MENGYRTENANAFCRGAKDGLPKGSKIFSLPGNTFLFLPPVPRNIRALSIKFRMKTLFQI
jgi:hypothetical protein